VPPASGPDGFGPWRLLRLGAATGPWNLACDEALLRSEDPRPALRLYAWSPAALSLGYFQPVEPFVARARRAGVALVRRPTGGGAIHHDRELTFALVAVPGRGGYPADVVEAYRRVHGAVADAARSLGADLAPRGGDAALAVKPRDATLCFEDTTSLDLVDRRTGLKVVGSAQRRRGGRVLHHGSIPLETPELSPGAGSLSASAGRRVPWDELADALVIAFDASFCQGGLAPSELSSAERSSARSLSTERYADLAAP